MATNEFALRLAIQRVPRSFWDDILYSKNVMVRVFAAARIRRAYRAALVELGHREEI